MKLVTFPKSFAALVCICLCLMSGLVLPAYTLAQEPPPRPSPGGGMGQTTNKDGLHHHENDNSLILGDITGTVIDLSTGLPGAGLIVQINDIPVRTDTSGHFSLTGIVDGEYLVNLSLPPEFIPAQAVQEVTIVNRNKVAVELAFYSVPPVLEPSDNPESLPQTGGLASSPWVYWTLGFILVLLGFSGRVSQSTDHHW